MPDDKEKNWLDRIANTIGEAIDDLLGAAAEGVIGIIPEPMKEQWYGAPKEAVGQIWEKMPPIMRDPVEQVMWGAEKLHEYAAEPFGATLLREFGIGPEKTGFERFMPPMFPPVFPGTPEMEQYKEDVPGWLRFGAESIPYFAIPTGGIGRAAKIGKEMPRMALRGARPPVRMPTAPTRTAVTPEGVRVRAGLEGVETAGTPPVKPPGLPVAAVALEPIPPKFKRIKLPELQNLEVAIHDQFDYMTGKLTQLTQRASQLPGFKQVMQQANPSVLAKDPHMRAVYSHAGIRQSGGSGSVYISSVLRSRYGDAVKTMGIDDAGRALGIKGEPYIGDVMTWPEKFALNPQQREFVDVVSDIMGQRLTRLQEKNIPIRVLNKIEEATGEVYGLELLGGKYFPRIYTGFRGVEPRALGMLPRKLKAKPPQMKERGWPTMKQGVEQGNIQYVTDPIETVERTLNAAYRIEADYGLVDFLKILPGVRTVKGTMIAEQSPLLAKRLNIRDSWRVFTSAKNALARAKAGGKVPQNTLDAIRRSHPALADDIVRIMETPRPRARALLAEIDGRFKQTSDRGLAELRDVNNRYRNVKASAAKLREGEGAVLNQPAFQGTILPQNIADDLTRYLSDQGFTIGRWTTTLNHMAIGLQTTVDFGFWMIQGLVLATRHPTIWARNIKSSLEVLASPKVYGRILEEKAPIVQEMIKARAAPLSGAEFTQFMRTGPLTKVPVLRNLFRRFTGMFDAYIDIGRVYLWEAKMVGANKKSANALRDLADHVDKMLGVSSSERIGLSATRRQVESAFVFYAPRWRRAVYGFIADVTQGGWRGAEARKALTALMVGGASIYTATALALDQEPNFDPRTGRFMTVKVGDSHIGLGTPYVALWRLAGNTFKQISEDPEAFVTFEEGTDHAFARYVRSSISPVSGLLWDAVEGRNFIGEQVNRDIENIGREAAETLLPFWASEFAQATIEGQEMPGAELAMGEFMGMRAWPVQPWEERKELRNKLSQEARGVDWYSPELLQKDRNALYAGSPELQQLDKEILERKIQTGDPPEIVDDWLRAEIKRQKYEKREELALRLLKGEINKSQFNFLWYGISRWSSGMYEAGELVSGYLDPKGQVDFEKWREEHTHPWDKALSAYYDIEDTASRERYLRSLAPNARQYVTYMLEEDWKFYLGPNAQKAQQMMGQTTTGGGGGFEAWLQKR